MEIRKGQGRRRKIVRKMRKIRKMEGKDKEDD